MRYLGGKSKLAKHICPILDNSLKNNKKILIEPFVGGFNIVPSIQEYEFAFCSDYHQGLIVLYNAMLNGWSPPDTITKEQYNSIKLKNNIFDPLTYFVSFGCSFAGKEWGGYARDKQNQNYCLIAKNSILKKFKNINLQKIHFKQCGFQDIDFNHSGLTYYCDPPYKDTTKYKTGDFNHDDFYAWCETQKQKGNDVFVSEFSAPSHWSVEWEKERKISVAKTNYKTKIDRLYKV